MRDETFIILDEARLFAQGRQTEGGEVVPAALVRPLPRAGEPEIGRRAEGDTDAFVSPKVPAWVNDPVKWRSLSRAERRQLERHHRKQTRGR